MDTLTYYKNHQEVCVFSITETVDRLWTLGSDTKNDWVIRDNPEVRPQHMQVKRVGNLYQYLVLAECGMAQGSTTIPSHLWLDLSSEEKLCLHPMNTDTYLVFRQNVIEVKREKLSSNSTSSRTMMASPGEKVSSHLDSFASAQTQLLPSEPEHSHDFAEAPTLSFSPQEFAKTALEVSPSGEDPFSLDEFMIPQEGDEQKLLLEEPQEDLLNHMFGKKPAERLEDEKIIAGRYEVVQVLGKGGMGIVYKVMDQKLHRHVALKLLLPQQGKSMEAIDRFFQEAKSMAKLHHENIVGIHDMGEHKGHPYFTMDLIDGKQVQDLLNNLKPRQIMLWMLKICEAIEYVHQCGIVHRDLKPSNIMIASHGPILMDFGIAKDEASQSNWTADGQSLGTPAYMAPEQARGLVSQIDAKTDIYGLGAILYEMLTGHAPFSGPPMQVIYKVCTSDPVPIQEYNPTVPHDVAVIVEKAMSKEKSLRYKSAEEMAKDIQRYLDGLRIHAQAPSLPVKIWRMMKRRRGLNYTLIAGSLLLALTLTLLFWQKEDAATSVRTKIKLLMDEALLKESKLQEESPLYKYIEISDLYTKVLSLDDKNREAQKGKFEITMKIANQALLVRDFAFAKAMCNIAIQMGVEPQSAQHKKNEIETQEKLSQNQLKNLLDSLFLTLKNKKE